MVVVISSRINCGKVIVNKEDRECGFISSEDLNPQKARVLLILALTRTSDRGEISRIFESLKS
ncbi:hypothetical protein [Helicobacter typhlonius]|uniref:L-asparaginase n=1 Tax=Helicobacter typhlonius TaxID=76936 RepID=A0A0S4PWM9_9HELI|nr:hypothetical protein LS75_007100 [Helicobacter typhlonius]CUU40691.1 L-asparaginase [Helicobacter typhlonius]